MLPRNGASEDAGAVDPLDYIWYCGEESLEKMFVKVRVTKTGTSGKSNSPWVSPIGTATLLSPTNEDGGYGFLELGWSSEKVTAMLGKQSPNQID